MPGFAPYTRRIDRRIAAAAGGGDRQSRLRVGALGGLPGALSSGNGRADPAVEGTAQAGEAAAGSVGAAAARSAFAADPLSARADAGRDAGGSQGSVVSYAHSRRAAAVS